MQRLRLVELARHLAGWPLVRPATPCAMASSSAEAAATQSFYSEETAEFYAKTMVDEMTKLRPRLERFAAGLPEGIILDTSCGTGDMLAFFASLGRPALHGVDLSAAMLAKARARCPTAEFTQGDMTVLEGWEAGSCAGVISSFAVHHLKADQAAEAVRRWASLLAPGGKLFLAGWEGSGDMDCGEDAPKDLVARKYSRATLESWLTDAGLAVSDVELEKDEMGDSVYFQATKPAAATA